MTQETGPPPDGPYNAYRELIDKIIAASARNEHLNPGAASDFRSFVWERLLASDILARYQGRCSVQTFLTIVIRNLYRDFRNHHWGKWRHSVQARRLGPAALVLEMLMVRDGHPFDQAVDIIMANHRLPVTRGELYKISLELPPRVRPRFVGEEELSNIAVMDDRLERGADRVARRARDGKVRDALRLALEDLEPQDRLILKLLFDDGFSVSKVAAALTLDQKALYRRRDRLFAALRRHLEAAGVRRDDIVEFLDAFGSVEDE